ncbi:MAG TPA: type II toxin-antitoxin system HicA family toxin [Bryobacteraceae bacterium]
MSQREKLLDRLKSKPKNFTWSELENLLEGLGYTQERGAGSRRKFIHRKTGTMISLHEPHPRKELKAYQIKAVLEHLNQEHQI